MAAGVPRRRVHLRPGSIGDRLKSQRRVTRKRARVPEIDICLVARAQWRRRIGSRTLNNGHNAARKWGPLLQKPDVPRCTVTVHRECRFLRLLSLHITVRTSFTLASGSQQLSSPRLCRPFGYILSVYFCFTRFAFFRSVLMLKNFKGHNRNNDRCNFVKEESIVLQLVSFRRLRGASTFDSRVFVFPSKMILHRAANGKSLPESCKQFSSRVRRIFDD